MNFNKIFNNHLIKIGIIIIFFCILYYFYKKFDENKNFSENFQSPDEILDYNEILRRIKKYEN